MRRPRERPLVHQHDTHERDGKAHRSGNENPAKGRHQLRGVRRCVDRKPAVTQYFARAADGAEHDGAEPRDDEGATERTEEVYRARRGPELMRLDRILNHHGSDRIHRPDGAAEQPEQERHLP